MRWTCLTISNLREVTNDISPGSYDPRTGLNSPVQFCVFGISSQLTNNLCFDLFVFNVRSQLIQISGLQVLPKHFVDHCSALDGVDDADRDEVGVQRVTVYQETREERTECVDTFNLLQSDVFTERQGGSSSAALQL